MLASCGKTDERKKIKMGEALSNEAKECLEFYGTELPLFRYGAECSEEVYVPAWDDEDAIDRQFHREEMDGEILVVIDTELHFGDPDHVKFRMADLPNVNKENEVLLMGMFVHPVDRYQPYSENPRLIQVDGNRYELLSSPELLIDENAENGTRKIISFDMFDYFI